MHENREEQIEWNGEYFALKFHLHRRRKSMNSFFGFVCVFETACLCEAVCIGRVLFVFNVDASSVLPTRKVLTLTLKREFGKVTDRSR